MPSTRLKAPRDATSISIHGEEYKVKDGFIEIPEMLVPIAEGHGYGKHAERVDLDAVALKTVGRTSAQDVADMGRGDLLVYCEDARIDVPPGTKLPKLREMVWRDMKTKQDLVDKIQQQK